MDSWVPPGYLAWAEVVDRAGQALFPKEWTGQEWKKGAGQPASPTAERRLREVSLWLRNLLADEGAKLVAVVQHRDGEPEKLPVEFWRSDLAPSVLRNGTLEQPGPPGAVRWDRPVLVRKSELEKCLRTDATIALVRKSELQKYLRTDTTIAYEKRCKKWFRILVKGPKQKTRQEYFEEAKRHYPALGRNAFRRIWDEVAPEEWKRPGWRRKHSDKSSQ